MKYGCINCRWHYLIPHKDHTVTAHCMKISTDNNKIDILGDACEDNFELIIEEGEEDDN